MQAALNAPLGDDVMGNDPTVNRLQEVAARILGKEAAVFMPSGTMANLVGLMIHSGHGDELFIPTDAHIYYYEVGSLASIAGYMPHAMPQRPGYMEPKELDAAIRPRNEHFPRPRVVVLENTHNLGGGSILTPPKTLALCEVARSHDLKVHLDGARIFNAAVALGESPRELVRYADTVMFCLSKGLSCPLGSILAGTAADMKRAREIRKRLGGSMRQAGVIAAMGLVALDSMIDRLAEDHANARKLAEGLAQMPFFEVDLATVQTNMVYCRPSGISRSTLLAAMERAGVMASSAGANNIRFVTHRHITADVIDEALVRIAKACESCDK